MAELQNHLAGYHERQPVQDARSGERGTVVAICDRMVCVRFDSERRWLFPDELAPAGPLALAA